MANEYVSLANLKLALGITDSARDTLLDYARAAASRAIDAHCGRRFYADGSATARTYRARGRVYRQEHGDTLIVDDISSATGLVVETGTYGGSTWTAVTDYVQEPENALAKGEPVTMLSRPLNVWMTSVHSAVRVTARWGWPATPDVVVEATLIQAARLYKRKDSPEGVTGSAEWGIIRVSRIDPDVQSLVRHLVIPAVG